MQMIPLENGGLANENFECDMFPKKINGIFLVLQNHPLDESRQPFVVVANCLGEGRWVGRWEGRWEGRWPTAWEGRWQIC